MLVITTHKAHLQTHIQHQIIDDAGEPRYIELPFVEFQEFVFLLVGGIGVVFVGEKGVGRSELHRESDVGTLAWVDRSVDRVSGQREYIAETMRITIRKDESTPVFHFVKLVGEGVRHAEVVVRPFELVGQRDGSTGNTGEGIQTILA